MTGATITGTYDARLHSGYEDYPPEMMEWSGSFSSNSNLMQLLYADNWR